MSGCMVNVLGSARTALLAGTFLLLVWLEDRRPLRPPTEPRARRIVRNLGVAALSLATVLLVERPVVGPLAALVARRGWGLVNRVLLPSWLAVAVAVVLLDYTLYLWHVLTHRVPWLWRLHVVHHVDLDLDASTALRFHFLEIAVSVAWRVGQVVMIGVSPAALSLWQTLLLLSIMFHHSNVRLPVAIERRLVHVLVTPRMHGIHHSTLRAETDSNWSSGLTLWDRVHRTLRLGVPQAAVTIGVPAYREPDDVTAPKILAMPLGRQRPTWEGPSPARAPGAATDALLA